MTIQEITALRKSGRIEEALAAAETEFSRNANNYTTSALFWCLNTLYKGQEPEEMSETIERMKSLYHEHCEGDEYMQKALASAERKLMPHFKTVKDALEEVKNGGNAIDIHQRIFDLYNHGEIDPQLYSDLGWLIYYTLRSTPLDDARRRKTLLNQYFQLKLERPSLLHSLILGEGVKVEQNTPLQFRIRDFIHIWDLNNLREDDWSQFKTDDGNTLPSLVEKLIGVYAKELKTDGVASPDDFSDLVDTALQRFPNNQNMPYFKANVLISQGRKEEALKYYRDLILRFPSKFYLWMQVSELIDDSDLKIGLLSKALNCGTEEEFIGGVRLRMARTLIGKGMPSNGRYELDRYRSSYMAKGWRLKSEFLELFNSVSSVNPAENNQQVYNDYSPMAEQFIYSGLPEQIAVKVADRQLEDRNRPGRKFTQWTLRADKDIFRIKKPAKYGLPPRCPNGTSFSIKVLNDKIVWIKQNAELPALDWVREVTGKVRIVKDRNGNPYAIIQKVYVGAKLLSGIEDGQKIKVLAIKQEDGRWSALNIHRAG